MTQLHREREALLDSVVDLSRERSRLRIKPDYAQALHQLARLRAVP